MEQCKKKYVKHLCSRKLYNYTYYAVNNSAYTASSSTELESEDSASPARSSSASSMARTAEFTEISEAWVVREVGELKEAR